jgi:protein SCO1/2
MHSHRPRRRLPRLLAGAVLALVLVLLAWRAAERLRPPSFHGTSFTDLAPAPDFSLTDHTGRAVTLSDYRGSVALVFFGYTHCPDVCPLTLARLARVLEAMGPAAKDVQVLLVTVDPERDTPDVLREYVGRFGPGIHGLTGGEQAVHAAMAGYGAYTMSGTSHGLDHSSAIYGIDRDGQLRVVLSPDAPEEEMLADIRVLAKL